MEKITNRMLGKEKLNSFPTMAIPLIDLHPADPIQSQESIHETKFQITYHWTSSSKIMKHTI